MKTHFKEIVVNSKNALQRMGHTSVKQAAKNMKISPFRRAALAASSLAVPHRRIIE